MASEAVKPFPMVYALRPSPVQKSIQVMSIDLFETLEIKTFDFKSRNSLGVNSNINSQNIRARCKEQAELAKVEYIIIYIRGPHRSCVACTDLVIRILLEGEVELTCPVGIHRHTGHCGRRGAGATEESAREPRDVVLLHRDVKVALIEHVA